MASPWTYIPIPDKKVPQVKTGGWGSIPVNARVGKTIWKTSLFPMKGKNYFIPIKRSVCEKESLSVGKTMTVFFSVV